MKDIVGARYTLEFKREGEAAQMIRWIIEHRTRLVEGGETPSSVARTLGVLFQSVDNWVSAAAAGRLRDVKGKALSAERMATLRPVRGTGMHKERDILN